MKQLLRLLLGIIPCFFFACEYSPSGSHYEEISPRLDVTDASITLHEQPDTFYVRGDIHLFFRVSIPGRHYYGYQLKLDDQIISQRHTSEIFFEENYLLKSANYGNGYHTFQILAFAESKSGSLADKKGEEGLVIYRTWVIHIDNSAPNPTLVTNVSPDDGQLKVEWEQFSGSGFDVFELHRNFEYKGDELVATFTDPSITSWKDPQYVGGRVHYHIVRRHKAYSIKGPSTMYEYYYPIVDYKYNKDNSLSFAFKSTPFYKNFNGYKITSIEGHQSINPGVKDTLVTWEAPAFGSQYLHIIVSPQSNHANGAAFSTGSHTGVEGPGTAWGPNYAPLFLRRPAVDRFYNFYGNRIEIIDGTTLLPLKERLINYHFLDYSAHLFLPISENAQHLYVRDDFDLLKLNPETLETQETIRLENIMPAGNEFWNKYSPLGIKISNNNRMLLSLYSISGDPTSVYVIDLNSRKVLAEIPSEEYVNELGISPDGKTITFDKMLFIEKSAGNWQKQKISIPEHTQVQFHPSRPQFMIKRDKVISFYSTVTGALEKTLLLEEEMASYDVDAGSGFLYGSGKMFFIYNLETMQLYRKVKLADRSNVASSSSTFVYKDRIFTRTRFMKL